MWRMNLVKVFPSFKFTFLFPNAPQNRQSRRPAAKRKKKSGGSPRRKSYWLSGCSRSGPDASSAGSNCRAAIQKSSRGTMAAEVEEERRGEALQRDAGDVIARLDALTFCTQKVDWFVCKAKRHEVVAHTRARVCVWFWSQFPPSEFIFFYFTITFTLLNTGMSRTAHKKSIKNPHFNSVSIFCGQFSQQSHSMRSAPCAWRSVSPRGSPTASAARRVWWLYLFDPGEYLLYQIRHRRRCRYCSRVDARVRLCRAFLSETF